MARSRAAERIRGPQGNLQKVGPINIDCVRGVWGHATKLMHTLSYVTTVQCTSRGPVHHLTFDLKLLIKDRNLQVCMYCIHIANGAS